MLSAKPKINSRSGQALAEMIPSIVIFVIIMMAGLSYYRVMRNATIREEVVRNLAFAKIGNSGTLTTPPDQIDPGSAPQLSPLNLAPESGPTPPFLVLSAQANPFMNNTSSCFTVYPENANDPIVLGKTVLGVDLNQVQFGTYAVVYRGMGQGTCP